MAKPYSYEYRDDEGVLWLLTYQVPDYAPDELDEAEAEDLDPNPPHAMRSSEAHADDCPCAHCFGSEPREITWVQP